MYDIFHIALSVKKAKNHSSLGRGSENRSFCKALGVSLALHSPLLLYSEKGREYWENRENITYAAKEKIKSVMSAHPAEKERYIEGLFEALRQGKPIDLGDFYLQSEYMEGRTDKKRMEKGLEKLSAVEADLLAKMDKTEVIEMLKEIDHKKGRYRESSSYLSTVLLDKKGNCQARQKFSASLIHRLYPDMEIAYQTMKIRGEMHTRTLVKIEGEWHSMERPEKALTEKDLEGSVIYGKYDYLWTYVGRGNLGSYKPENERRKTHTKFTVTDDYLDMPLPEGADEDLLKNFDSAASSRAYGGGQALVGTPSTGVPEGEKTTVSPYGRDAAQGSMKFEIIKPDTVWLHRMFSEMRFDHWRFMNTAEAAEREAKIREYLPEAPDSCIEGIAIISRVASEAALKSCEIHPWTGTLSCNFRKYDTYKQVSPIGSELDRNLQKKLDTCNSGETGKRLDLYSDKKVFFKFGIANF